MRRPGYSSEKEDVDLDQIKEELAVNILYHFPVARYSNCCTCFYIARNPALNVGELFYLLKIRHFSCGQYYTYSAFSTRLQIYIIIKFN